MGTKYIVLITTILLISACTVQKDPVSNWEEMAKMAPNIYEVSPFNIDGYNCSNPPGASINICPPKQVRFRISIFNIDKLREHSELTEFYKAFTNESFYYDWYRDIPIEDVNSILRIHADVETAYGLLIFNMNSPGLFIEALEATNLLKNSYKGYEYWEQQDLQLNVSTGIVGNYVVMTRSNEFKNMIDNLDNDDTSLLALLEQHEMEELISSENFFVEIHGYKNYVDNEETLFFANAMRLDNTEICGHAVFTPKPTEDIEGALEKKLSMKFNQYEISQNNNMHAHYCSLSPLNSVVYSNSLDSMFH